MVQYILTPWRDRQELLLVRHQFYASSPSWLGEQQDHSAPQRQPQTCSVGQTDQPTTASRDAHHVDDVRIGEERSKRKLTSTERLRCRQRQQLHQAVARVSMWMQRGNCPHMVESTALLTAAVLSDEEDLMLETNLTGVADVTASSAYAVRAAYSAAFSRFVTGLLDGHQDKQRKQSMYSLARTIGLPATFVELRHQSTHEQLPSLAKLRSAAKKALRWIWDYYWRPLADDDLLAETCEDALLRCLREEGEDTEGRRLELEKRWDAETLLGCLSRLQASLPGNQAYLKCQRLVQEINKAEEQRRRSSEEEEGHDDNEVDEPSSHAPVPASEVSLDDGKNPTSSTGWSLYDGPWKAKPIGIV